MRLISIPSGVGVMVSKDRFLDLSRKAPELPRTLRGILEAGEPALSRIRFTSASPDIKAWMTAWRSA